MASEQDWCLECGAAVTTRVAKAPGWGVPVAIIAAVLLGAGALVWFLVDDASNDADKSVGPKPAGTAAAARPPFRGPVPAWRSATRAFTLVTFTSRSRPAAEAQARRLITARQRAGVLRTNGYAGLRPGYWLTWSGQYADRATAQRARPVIARLAPSARVTLVQTAAAARASTKPPAPAPGQ